MASDSTPWTPDWAVPPGEILTETLADRGMTQAELARRMDRPLKTISEIATGKAAITPQTAIQLERTLGISARFWNKLETNYREALARDEARSELQEQTAWLKQFPIAAMTRLGLIKPGPTDVATLESLLGFFAVSRPSGWENQWGKYQAEYRSSGAYRPSRHALSAWLRWGELMASHIDVGEYDESAFSLAVVEARPLTRLASFGLAIRRLTQLLARTGVAFVVVPELPGTRISGAARWHAGRPVIQLSLRYRTDDQFWFSVFHECGHILTGKKGTAVVEDIGPADTAEAGVGERRANEFARNALIPQHQYRAFVAAGDLAARSIRDFAAEVGTSPGIVVGRLEHDKLVLPGRYGRLKRHFEVVLS